MSLLKIIPYNAKQDWQKTGFYENIEEGLLHYNILPAFILNDSTDAVSFFIERIKKEDGQAVVIDSKYIPYNLIERDSLTQKLFFKRRINNYGNVGLSQYKIVTSNKTYKSEPFYINSYTPVVVPDLSIIATKTDETSLGANNGTIQIDVTGGVAPYIYSYSGTASGNFETSNLTYTFTNLAPGDYIAKVEDSIGNIVTQNLTINAFVAPLTLSLQSKIDESESGANYGQITLSVIGGVAPYEYSIGGAYQGSNQFTGLAPNTYTCTVRDSESTTDSIQVVIEEEEALPSFSISTSKVYQGIMGEIGGTIIVTAYSPGVAPFEYSKDGGSTWQSSEVFNDLADGNYQMIARDSNLTLSNTIVVNITAINLGSPTVDVDMSDTTWLTSLSTSASYSYVNPIGTIGINDGETCELKCNTLLTSFYGQSKKILAILDLGNVNKTGIFNPTWEIGTNGFIKNSIPENYFTSNKRVLLNVDNALLISEPVFGGDRDIMLTFNQSGGAATNIEVTRFKLWLYD